MALTLQWQSIAPGARGQRTTCGRYSVCSINDHRGETFEAWKLVPMGTWFAPLKLGLPTMDEAKAAAEADLETSRV